MMTMYDLTNAERDAIVNLLKVKAHADRERAKILDRKVPHDWQGYHPQRELAKVFNAQAEERRALAFRLEEKG